MILAHFGYPGWMSVSSREESEVLEKSENMMLGGAVGAPEARNMLGMLVVMSLRLSISIGGVQSRFSKNHQKPVISLKNDHIVLYFFDVYFLSTICTEKG